MNTRHEITTLPSVDGTSITRCNVAPAPRNRRRQAETEAVATLLTAHFGRDCLLLHDASGAPSADGYEGYISISHTKDYAFLAVDGHRPVGIDAEPWRDSLPALAPRFMTERELAVYGTDPALTLRAWTTKEAVFKALGMPQIVVSDITLPSDPEASELTVAGRRLSLHFITSQPDFAVTLARLLP